MALASWMSAWGPQSLRTSGCAHQLPHPAGLISCMVQTKWPQGRDCQSISEDVNMPSLDDSGKEKLFPE